MSASLVGSEMCIRDRCTCMAAASRVQPLLNACWLRRCKSALRPRHVGPVSYTHLTLPTICSV
eukprot:14731076-Alexandrium_andersonii.AAC.1